MTNARHKLGIFAGYGVELEYMIVDQDDLVVVPVADKLIYEVAKAYKNEVELGEIAWSNELALHLIELKANGPCKDLLTLPPLLQENILKINEILKKYSAKLLPTGAHPWMNPLYETKLWPHSNKEVYSAYDKIFSCNSHGWSNLQSVHLNLPFANDEEFAHLHAAIRLVLPLIPAISASSPIIDGKITGFIDSRLEVYRHNQEKIPSITGEVIPEPIFSQKEYEEKILKRMYADIAPFDVEALLQEEWLNSRGAIARFDRNTIEIRIMDVQECPAADIAILQFIVAVLKSIVAEQWLDYVDQITWSEKDLNAIFVDVVKNGQRAVINNVDYLSAFGYKEKQSCTARQLWQYILQKIERQYLPVDDNIFSVMKFILSEGNLSERILTASSSNMDMKYLYHQLSDCLQSGKMFHA